jgi:hypothetical protein
MFILLALPRIIDLKNIIKTTRAGKFPSFPVKTNKRRN